MLRFLGLEKLSHARRHFSPEQERYDSEFFYTCTIHAKLPLGKGMGALWCVLIKGTLYTIISIAPVARRAELGAREKIIK